MERPPGTGRPLTSASRDLLEEALCDLEDLHRVRLVEELKPLDRRFAAATTEDGAPLLFRYTRAREGWWWRWPKRLGELAPYLEDNR